jgi:phytoene synthase
LFKGTASDSITAALLPAVKSFGLVEDDFQSIIDGMEMDATVICAPDEKAFDLYCDRVASAVGRVSVRIFGDSSPKAMEVAHHLGRALQITNILRDLAEDSARHRLYLPTELLAKHGMTSRNPAEIVRDIRLPAVCRELAERAAGHFAGADRAIAECIPAAMRPARVMRAYYSAILQRLVASDWQDPFKRVSLPAWQKIFLVLRFGII